MTPYDVISEKKRLQRYHMSCIQGSNILNLTTTQKIEENISDLGWFVVVYNIYT